MNALHTPINPTRDAAPRHAHADSVWSGLAGACAAKPIGALSSRVLGMSAPFLQTKLVLGHPADNHEREADDVAERVMREPDPVAAAKTCAGCDKGLHGDVVRRQSASPWRKEDGLLEPEGEATAGEATAGETPVQAASMPGRQPRLEPGLANSIQALRRSGDAMPAPLRQFMEPRFGHDFARVRLHTGPDAAQLSSRLGARAFTVGRNVFFGRGEFDPQGATGRRLIAHELAHVVQQGQASRHPVTESKAHPAQVAGTPSNRETPAEVIRRVAWWPNVPTGGKSLPWGSAGPAGRVLRGATDAGAPLEFWRPNDGATYWCHGFTFGGSAARGGPYSIWGQDVPTVLRDDGWQTTYGCMAQRADILVFRDAQGQVTHSGQIRRVSAPSGAVDEANSLLESKWGAGSHNTESWQKNALKYGRYTCYSKAPQTGVCNGQGAHEA